MQPWAWAIAAGHKRVENRSRPIGYRGELAIHAGKSKKWMRGLSLATALLFDKLESDWEKKLVYGAIVASARLVACLPVEAIEALNAEEPDRYPFATGPWCWILEDVVRLETPMPCRGAQGLWFPPMTFTRVHQRGPRGYAGSDVVERGVIQ